MVFYRVENIVGKGEIAGFQHFTPNPTMFLRVFLTSVTKKNSKVPGKEE